MKNPSFTTDFTFSASSLNIAQTSAVITLLLEEFRILLISNSKMKVKGWEEEKGRTKTKIFLILYTLKKTYNFSLKVTKQLSPKFIKEV